MSEDLFFALIFLSISATLNVAFLAAWFQAYRRLKKLEKRELAAPDGEERAARVEDAIETLTAQVDQLASGQEFLNRVLMDRLPKGSHSASAPEREITPH